MLGVVGIGALVVISYSSRGPYTQPIPIIAGGLNLMLLAGWTFLFRPGWVKTAADAYAERLLETIENL